MRKLTHPTVLLVDKRELIEFQLKYILHGKVSVTKTELKILSYLFLYKDKVIDKIIEYQLLTSRKSTENYISTLRGKGLIHGMGSKTRLHPNINLVEEDLEFTIKLKLLKNEEVSTELQKEQ